MEDGFKKDYADLMNNFLNTTKSLKFKKWVDHSLQFYIECMSKSNFKDFYQNNGKTLAYI